MEENQVSETQQKGTTENSKKIVIILMGIAFVIMLVTGILKFRELMRPFHIPYDQLPMQQISLLHDRAGVVLLLLIIIHLIFNRSRFVSVSKSNNDSKKNFIIGTLIILIAAGGFLRASGFNLQSFFPKAQNVIPLGSVEITGYSGEKLSSISDFRENSIKGPQYIDIKTYTLNITGLVDKDLSLTYDQVVNRDMYSKVVTLNCVEGRSVKILREGVLLKDLLDEAGIQTGSNTVIFYAVDGYSSSLPLDYIMNNDIMLAYKMNGVAIPPSEGYPFMVVAENKRGYKRVKRVTRIEVSNDPSFKGYREKAGYNQNGNLTGPIFE